MKKFLAIFMAIVTIFTMFSFATVAFAEEAAEASVGEFYAGGGGTSSSIKDGRKTKPWGISYLNVNDPKGKTLVEGNPRADGINDLAASGEYSAIYIYILNGTALIKALEFSGLKGTETTPIIITVDPESMSNPSVENEDKDNPVSALTIKDCEYVTVGSFSLKSETYTGLTIENCKNVTVEGMQFNKIGYTDYTYAVSDKETGVTTRPNMETADLLSKGAGVIVGTGNTDIAIKDCTFANCRAGIVFDATVPAPAEGEEAAVATSGVAISNCSFSNINESAVLLKNASNVTVEGGLVEKAGGLSEAQDFDGRTLAAVSVIGGKDNTIGGMEVGFSKTAVELKDTVGATVERMYSHDNAAFMYNTLGAAADARIRYNVSANDGASVISTAAADGVKVYNNTFASSAAIDMSKVSNLVVKNNIFSMAIGNKVALGEGDFDANCYHWTSKADSSSIKKNPQFANAWTDADCQPDASNPDKVIQSKKTNFILSTESPCLGKGVQVEEDMGAKDFYGNDIGSTHNIGADEGAGAGATYELVSNFVDTFNYIIAVIKNFFENLFK